ASLRAPSPVKYMPGISDQYCFTYRSGSLKIVRAIAGQGRLITSSPPEPAGTLFPSRVTTSAITPGSGSVADPGLVGTAPGSGEIMIMPVSVCHHVSTIGQRLWPISSRYHIHASGLIGSPTVPSRRRVSILCLRGYWSPHLMNARIAVGAV